MICMAAACPKTMHKHVSLEGDLIYGMHKHVFVHVSETLLLLSIIVLHACTLTGQMQISEHFCMRVCNCKQSITERPVVCRAMAAQTAQDNTSNTPLVTKWGVEDGILRLDVVMDGKVYIGALSCVTL